MSKLIKVIAITVEDRELYLAARSCLDVHALTESPYHAIDFSRYDESVLTKALDSIVVEGDAFFAKSGIRSSKLPEVVEFEVYCIERSRKIGRELHSL